MLNLEPIKARAEAATKGPWGARELPQMVRGANATLHSAHGTGEVWSVEFSPEIGSTVSIPDAEFIAAARTDIPALISRIRELEVYADDVRELHYPVGHECLSDQCFPSCEECGKDYPCPTILALDGTP